MNSIWSAEGKPGDPVKLTVAPGIHPITAEPSICINLSGRDIHFNPSAARQLAGAILRTILQIEHQDRTAKLN